MLTISGLCCKHKIIRSPSNYRRIFKGFQQLFAKNPMSFSELISLFSNRNYAMSARCLLGSVSGASRKEPSREDALSVIDMWRG